MSVFCPQCGAPVEEGVRSCAYCGVAISQPVQQPVYCAPQAYGAPQQPYPQQPYPQQPYGAPQQPQHPMAWYKFVIYVQLFLSALLNFSTGIQHLLGDVYELEYQLASRTIYGLMPDLKALDIFHGLGLIGVAIFDIVVRSNLKRFKRNGPMMYYCSYGIYIMLYIIYQVGFGIILEVAAVDVFELDFSYLFISVIIFLLYLICNVIYFNKRKDLFVN